ncbi:MAG TPA: hypothetical protein VL977_04080, partial [Solirubrobacteraceae bacterium]|nr:hypothetical protein [Solirubrobacteraceae bacterium]
TTVQAAEASYASTRAEEQQKVAAVCPPPTRTLSARITCHDTRVERRVTDAAALLARHDAIRTYVAALEANRVTFWRTIHSLRGGAGIKADPPITQPSPQQNPS